MRALTLLLFVSSVGCGGRLIDEESSSAPAVDAGSSAPEASRTTPGTVPSGTPDAGASAPYTPTSPTNFLVDTAGCGSRPWGSPGATGYATTIVDEWIRARVAECGAPATCGTMIVHFSRTPSPACVDLLRFTVPPPSSFVSCLVTAMSRERLAAGNFVDGDSRTVELCP